MTTSTTHSLFRHLGGVPVGSSTPSALAGGNVYFVNPSAATPGDGTSPDTAVTTLESAYNKCKDGNNDVVVLWNSDYNPDTGAAASSGLNLPTAGFTWAKSYTHLVGGGAAPTVIGNRNRMFLPAASVAPTMFTVTGTGCYFANFYIFHGVASTSSLVCWEASGPRCYYENVHFAGIGNATGQGDVAGARSLKVSDEEQTFVNCTVGVDTIARSTTNAELEVATGTNRTNFYNCRFFSFADSADHVFVKITGLDRELFFVDCIFYNAIKSTATTMTEAFAIDSSSGLVLLKNCTLVGATDWENPVSNYIYIDGAAPTAGTSGLAINIA